LNEDKPYGQFVAEQIAGDALYPNSRDGIEALGFIAAGPWDLIGHAEVPETKTDGRIARHLDRDDMVANAIGTFCSVTIHCAQCHDHKFDPFTQDDYYALQAVFAALDRGDRRFYLDAEKGMRSEQLRAKAKWFMTSSDLCQVVRTRRTSQWSNNSRPKPRRQRKSPPSRQNWPVCRHPHRLLRNGPS
jgi:hypothetical protein